MPKQRYKVKTLGCTLGISKEKLSFRCGLVALARLLNALKLDQQADRLFLEPGSNRGYRAGTAMNALILMLNEGGDCLDALFPKYLYIIPY